MASSDGVITTVVLATGVNVYGATQRQSDPFITIIAGFVVGAFLLGVASAAPELAELFAAAYAITSFTLNGTELINAVNKITTGSPAGTQPTISGSTDHNTQGVPFTQVVAN